MEHIPSGGGKLGQAVRKEGTIFGDEEGNSFSSSLCFLCQDPAICTRYTLELEPLPPPVTCTEIRKPALPVAYAVATWGKVKTSLQRLLLCLLPLLPLFGNKLPVLECVFTSKSSSSIATRMVSASEWIRKKAKCQSSWLGQQPPGASASSEAASRRRQKASLQA